MLLLLLSSLFSNVDDDDATNFDESVLRVGLLLFVSITQRSKEWRPFRRPKNKTFFCATKKKQKRETERERETERQREKEKSPNCLMYHYKKIGFKEKGYHIINTEGLVFWKK